MFVYPFDHPKPPIEKSISVVIREEKTVTKKFPKNQAYLAVLIITLLLNGCRPSVEEIQAVETKIAAEVFETQTAVAPTTTPTPSPTLKPTNTPWPIPDRAATMALKATSTAQPMADFIQELFTRGYLQSTQGKFIQLADFNQSLAQINTVQYNPTDINMRDFVLRSTIAWETARQGANIYYSGCGFYFGVDENFNNYHIILITLDGSVKLLRCWKNCRYIEDLARKYFDKIDYMEGDAEFVLVIENGTIQAFVNGRRIFVRRDQKKFKGTLGYAISSGTNAGFGTSCTFTDTEIWSDDLYYSPTPIVNEKQGEKNYEEFTISN
jgi:hypothetical protein